MSVRSNRIRLAARGYCALEMTLVLLRKWMPNLLSLINFDVNSSDCMWLVATVLDSACLENLK